MHDPLRPTFEHELTGVPPAMLADRLARRLSGAASGPRHRRAGVHFLIWLPDGRRHLWSPWLHLDVNAAPDGEESTMLFGRFTPAPSLWTAVMLAYLALGTLAVGGGLFGYAQWSVGEAAWGLWLPPAAALGAVLLLASSRVGQGLARDQMAELVAAVQDAMKETDHVRPLRDRWTAGAADRRQRFHRAYTGAAADAVRAVYALRPVGTPRPVSHDALRAAARPLIQRTGSPPA